MLFFLLARRTQNRDLRDLMTFFLKVCAVSAITAAICYPVMQRLGGWISWRTVGGAFVDLAIVTSLGILVLLALGRVFRLREMNEYLRELWRMARGRLGNAAAADSHN